MDYFSSQTYTNNFVFSLFYSVLWGDCSNEGKCGFKGVWFAVGVLHEEGGGVDRHYKRAKLYATIIIRLGRSVS